MKLCLFLILSRNLARFDEIWSYYFQRKLSSSVSCCYGLWRTQTAWGTFSSPSSVALPTADSAVEYGRKTSLLETCLLFYFIYTIFCKWPLLYKCYVCLSEPSPAAWDQCGYHWQAWNLCYIRIDKHSFQGYLLQPWIYKTELCENLYT